MANRIVEQYQPESVEDIQNALKDIFGPMFEAMLKGDMNNYLGYTSNEKGEKQSANRRNGYGKKTVKTLNRGNGYYRAARPRGIFRPAIYTEKETRRLNDRG